MRIDLHTHSTASDGTLTPGELIEAAVVAGLDVVALTDHDGVAGWPEAELAARRHGIEFVPGVELSCRWFDATPPLSLHVLAYYIDPAHERLAAEMARVRSARGTRAQAILERMRADGVDVTWDEVKHFAGDAPVGRPHVARALVERGLANSVSDAFAPSMLGERWRVPKADTDVFLALDLIRSAGGVSVFAHPRATIRGRVAPDELIELMAQRGLFGLEAEHEDHTPAQRAQVRALAKRLGLEVTGSSDFHGANKPIAIGANLTSPEAYQRIRAACGR